MNATSPSASRPYAQTGTALMMALVILLIMSLTALSAVRLSSFGTKLGANEEIVAEAFQNAQSVVDAALTDPNNIRVQGEVGLRFCTTGVAGCSALYTIELAEDLFADEIADGKVEVAVERLAPALAPPPRAVGSSLVRFKAARFRIEGIYDRAAEGLGRDEVDQGVLILIPSS